MSLADLEVDILLPGHNQIVKSLPKGLHPQNGQTMGILFEVTESSVS